MRKNLLLPGLLVVVAASIAIAAARTGGGPDAERADTPVSAGGPSRASRLVRADSPRLADPADSRATFVEFLDFECEACRAAFPAVEQLRQRYGDRVTFVVRHMPLHNNSEAAARAAEAAAEQGKFEEMHRRLFETQPEWGERQDSQEDVFFRFAEDLDLDMDRFRKVYDDPRTIARVKRDKADGTALGVTGTPTFFLDGDKLDIRSFDDLTAAFDDAVAT